MILYLVRHGETAYNRDGLGLGRADIPLTELGLRQAATVGARFAEVPLDRILTSPLSRAADVAAAIAGERLALERREELVEMDVGETEGLTFAAMREQFADFLKQWGGPGAHAIRMPGGESIDDIASRLEPLIAEVRSSEAAAVALVSHNFVLRVAICQLLGIPAERFRSIGMEVASVTTIAINGQRLSLQSLNDTCHLRHLSLPASGRTVSPQ